MSSVFVSVLSAFWLSTGPVHEADIRTPDDEAVEDKGPVLLVGAVGAEVYVNDELVGTLPGYVDLEEGIHFFKTIDESGEECSLGRDVRFYEGGPPPVIHIDC